MEINSVERDHSRLAVYKSWKHFDLPKMQMELDEAASELVNQQNESEAARKRLVEQSREFKKAVSKDAMDSVIPLLKSFQTEIDALSRRSKNAEAAFLSVYKKLINLPDPVSMLALTRKERETFERTTQMEDDKDDQPPERWKETTDHSTFIRKIKEQFGNNDKKPEHKLQPDNEQRDLNLNRAFAEKESHLQESYFLLAKRLHEAECHVVALKNALDNTKCELVDVSEKYEAALQAKSREHNQTEQIELLQRRVPVPTTTPVVSTPMHGQRVFDVDRLLQIVDARLKGRSDYSEIKLAVIDALTDCIRSDDEGHSSDTRVSSDSLTTHKNGGRLLTSNPKNSSSKVKHDPNDDDDDDDYCDRTSSSAMCPETSDKEPSYASSESINRGSAHSSPGPTQTNAPHPSPMAPMSMDGIPGFQFPLQLNSFSSNSDVLSQVTAAAAQPESPSSERSYLPPPPLTINLPAASGCNASFGLLPGPLSVHRLAKTESATGIQSLDTANVAQRIREILSAHNIGQRLFARHVLGLSQGTVSELLSKPKHWDKLTEKGRESYRRMFQWASDDNNIIVLKAYAPKKGSSVVLANCEPDDAATEERIAQILSEAKVAMQLKNTDTTGESASAMVASIYCQELARLNQSNRVTNGLGRGDKPGHKGSRHSVGVEGPRGRKPQTDSENLTQDIVARIYQEELLKLVSAAEVSGNSDELSLYRQELERLSMCSRSMPRMGFLDGEKKICSTEDKENTDESSYLNGPLKSEAMSYHRWSSEDEDDDDRRSETRESSDLPQDLRVNKPNVCSSELPRHGSSAFTLVQPRSTRPHTGGGGIGGSGCPCDSPTPYSSSSPTTDGISPLQQMQSIANSLLTKSQRPLRAVLPQITQEQIDRYANINTDDLVKRVKDMLSQYSISQRLFGENVLGLSQGSVSDLLARPKPWHMLTQKGREPFIRMQIFLEDETSVSKLVAAQFQIPTDKPLRCSSAYSDSTNPGHHTESSGCYISTSSPSTPPPIQQPPSSIAGVSSSSCPTNLSIKNPPLPPTSRNHPSSLTSSTPDPVHHHHHHLTKHSIDNFLDKPFIKSEDPAPMMNDIQIKSNNDPLPLGIQAMLLPTAFSFPPAYFHPSLFLGLHQFGRHVESDLHMSSSACEPTDMSQELDTLDITTKVKEVLQFHNLGQKLFGEAVLGLSQGSVSELLSKPKPWHMLSLKGREPFLKMQMWLLDPLSISRLRMYQDQLKTKKRKGSSEEQLSDSQLLQKKPRIFFTEDQKISLRKAYASDPYPTQSTLDKLASDLGVGTKTVINWFHNHRMRAKQQQQQQQQGVPVTSYSPTGNGTPRPPTRSNYGEEFSCASDDENEMDSASFTDDTKHRGETGSEVESGYNRPISRCSIPPAANPTEDFVRQPGSSPVYEDVNKNEPEVKQRDSGCYISTGSKSQPDVTTSAASVRQCFNKRKSARPQWIKDGVVLDKSLGGAYQRGGGDWTCLPTNLNKTTDQGDDQSVFDDGEKIDIEEGGDDLDPEVHIRGSTAASSATAAAAGSELTIQS